MTTTAMRTTWQHTLVQFAIGGRVTAEFIKRAESGVQWWIGDWLLYGEGKPEWGDRYEAACELFGREQDAIKQYKSISKAFELCTRVNNLSWSHHREVASEEPSRRTRLLQEAVDAGESLEPFRAFAWELGAAADFAAGLEAVA
jgi:hypothetical protein